LKSINDYKARVGKYDGIKGSIEKHAKHTIGYYFKDSPSYEEVYINHAINPTGVQIISDTKQPNIKIIVMHPNDSIHAGDYVFRTKYEEEYWLCTGYDPTSIYSRGFIEKCNTTLKWIDENGDLLSYPCVFYYGAKANFGTYADRVMTLPDGRRQVVVQKNEHTMKIKRNDRFIFGGNVFQVIDHDYVSDEGIVNINMKDDQFDPARDNLDLGIADYYGSNINTSTYKNNVGEFNKDEWLLVIKSVSDKPNEIKRNQSKEYYVEVRDETEALSDAKVIWELYADDKVSNATLATLISFTDTSCVIKNNNANSGFVWLRCYLLNHPHIERWMQIEMKSLF
jgi:hypothetical protein